MTTTPSTLTATAFRYSCPECSRSRQAPPFRDGEALATHMARRHAGRWTLIEIMGEVAVQRAMDEATA